MWGYFRNSPLYRGRFRFEGDAPLPQELLYLLRRIGEEVDIQGATGILFIC